MPEKKAIINFSLRFVGFTFVVAIIIAAASVTAALGPSRSLYSDDSWKDSNKYTPPGYDSTKHNIILDQHSHTIHSDGQLTVKQNVEWHLAMGFNTMVITDHNTMNHKEDVAAAKIEYEGRAIIILGMEWTTNRVHLNFLGLSDWDFEAFPIPRTPTDDQIKAAINEAHRQGAVVTINHYPWSLNQAKMQNHPTRDQAVAWGINFIEIINDDSHYENMYDAESVQFIQEKGGIGMITGTDMHRPDKLESGAVHGWTLLNATEFTEEAVMVELRAGRTEIIYLPAGFVDTGNYPENPAYLAVFPLAELGNIFIGMFSRGLRVDEIAITIGYVYLIFIGKEITMIVGDRIKKKKSNE